MRAHTNDNRVLDLVPILHYDGVFFAPTTGEVYLEDHDNPAPLLDEERFPEWLFRIIDDEMRTEVHPYQINLRRMEYDRERGEVRLGNEYAFFYEYALNGNGSDKTYGSVDEMFLALFSDLIPPGSTIVTKDLRTPRLETWSMRNWRLFLIDARDEDTNLIDFDEIDWELTARTAYYEQSNHVDPTDRDTHWLDIAQRIAKRRGGA